MRPSSLRVLFTVCAAATIALGCFGPGDEAARDAAGSGEVATDELVAAQLGTISRLHVHDGLLLASQPSPDDLRIASNEGIRNVVNLRLPGENPDFDEVAVAAKLGLGYVSLPFKSVDDLSDDFLDRARELLGSVDRPALVHCSSANRVGAIWLPWRVLDGGLDYDRALAEAKTIGLTSPDYEAKVRDYIERRR